MSVRIMSLVWELDLPDSEKIVLLALADCANDEGEAWPSMATLSRKCSKSDRTCQGVIKTLVAKGLLDRIEIAGKGCRYWVKPASPEIASGPQPLRGAEVSPPKRTTSTPEAASDKPSRTTNTSGAKAPSVKRERASDAFPRPDGVDPQHWADFLENRKRKRLPNTTTAHKRLMDDLARFSDAEWPPGRILQHAAERGWAGIYDPRESRNGQRSGYGGGGAADRRDGIARALDRRLGLDDAPGEAGRRDAGPGSGDRGRTAPLLADLR